ncbi:hypothetical protein GCM10028805_54310 [Spirosoma harenae]
MQTQIIDLPADLQKRMLLAIRTNQFNLADFPELQIGSPSPRPIIDTDDFTQEELELMPLLSRTVSFLRASGQLSLSKQTKVKLLRACQRGWLDLAEVPELIQVRQTLRPDFSGVPPDQLRLLVKISRLRKNGY